MATYPHPLYYYNNILFNDDLYNYASTSLTLLYANSHYLFSYPGAIATSNATYTYFNNNVQLNNTNNLGSLTI